MKLLKWLLAVLGLTVIAVLALLTASNRVEAQEVLVGDWVLDAAASKSAVPQMPPMAGTLTNTDAGGGIQVGERSHRGRCART